MPNRLIREGFLDSEAVASLSDWAERVYHRLLIAADDAGRFDGRTEILRARLLPLGSRRTSDYDTALSEIADQGLVLRYQVAGKPYLQITKWQMCSNAKLSKYPWTDGTYQIAFVELQTRDGAKSFVASSVAGPDAEGFIGGRPNPPERCPSRPDPIGIPSASHRHGSDPHTPSERSETETETETETKAPTDSPRSPDRSPAGAGGDVRRSSRGKAQDHDEGFVQFWTLYPKKVGKGAAFIEWRKLGAADRAAAIAKVGIFAAAWLGAPEERRQFIVDPERWLKRRRWEDDPAEWRRAAANGNGHEEGGSLTAANPPPREMTPAFRKRLEENDREIEEMKRQRLAAGLRNPEGV